ncbi:phopshatase [Trypanosoma grayi]|uniref:phopshatase n=1 Tax=Trypanosoma grayi TaxID=71804 RepID=UPI0004F45C79|nr:phopshatase [Trypanosoma grayi]KEG11055.1 phopshatase [Trypanosoma grayi]
MENGSVQLFLASAKSVELSGDEGSSSSEDSVSLSSMPITKAKKFAPSDADEIACDLEEEIRQSRSSGDCDLSQLQLLTVPNGLPLETLVSLTLSDNKLTELPSHLFEGQNCASLVRFDANSNKLKSLPVSLFALTKLEVLLLDHNEIVYIPYNAEQGSSGVFLPSLKRVGLEFNKLQRFPVEFFSRCPLLEDVYLGQNEKMLDVALPTDQLRAAAVLHGALREKMGTARQVLLKVDNRPRFLQQMKDEKWEDVLPWLNIDLHKIYPDKVLGFLYLGSLRTAQTTTVYHDLNIRYILTVARRLDVKVEPGMKHLVLPVEDLPGEDLRPLFSKAFDFIDQARQEKKGVLLHCFAGLSRSVAVAAAYIMSRYAMSRDEALNMIKEARPAAQPNPGFMDTLARYEEQLEMERGADRLFRAARNGL